MLTERLSIPTSPDTLLPGSQIRHLGDPIANAERSWRRRLGLEERAPLRHILVDLKRNEVVDLLPDLQAETLARCLRHHPGIEIIARDRAGTSTRAVRALL